jgi:hypothetical protein
MGPWSILLRLLERRENKETKEKEKLLYKYHRILRLNEIFDMSHVNSCQMLYLVLNPLRRLLNGDFLIYFLSIFLVYWMDFC